MPSEIILQSFDEAGNGKLPKPEGDALPVDIFLVNVFNAITEVLEAINLEGYLVGMNLEDPQTYPVKRTGNAGVTIEGKFLLVLNADDKEICFSVDTHDGDGESRPNLMFELSPGSWTRFFIEDATNCRTWKPLFGPASFFDCLASTIRTLYLEPRRVTKFKGFKLVPHIDGSAEPS